MTKNGLFSFFIAVILLILSVFIPNGGVSMPNPWRMIVNHVEKQCAIFHIGVGNDIDQCDLPKDWNYSQQYAGSAGYICPEGYQNTNQQFLGRKCRGINWGGLPDEKPIREERTPSRFHGFGCAPRSPASL